MGLAGKGVDCAKKGESGYHMQSGCYFSMQKCCTMSFLWPPAAVMLCCSVIVLLLVPMDSLLDHYESKS